MLKDKIVVITGGAGLLGKEFAKAVSEQGAQTILTDVNSDEMERAVEYTGTSNIETMFLDITSEDSLRKVINHLKNKYGKVDAVVNSAYPRNRHYGRHFFDVEYTDFCENLNLNLGGYFLSCQQFGKFFINQGFGNIVNIASIYGVCAPKFSVYDKTAMTMPVEYAAIKSGLIHLTKYMAAYMKGKNIRINCISPGGIEDGQPEIFLKNYKEKCLNKGMLDKKDISGTLIYLLSDMSRYVNGQNIIVDDGFSL